MSKRTMLSFFCMVLGCVTLSVSRPISAEDTPAPETRTYLSADGSALELRIFRPAIASDRPRAAVLLFHGGGWNEGEASWMDASAETMARNGMIGIAVEYRLSGKNGVTPFDAVSDARHAVRWVRREATALGIDPHRIAVAGTSAGAHLAVSTAVFDQPWGDPVSARPDALVLRSPAVDVAGSSWFRKLTGGPAQAAALSPELHVRTQMPPTLILQGAEDNVTPAAGSQRFCERMQQRGNRCVLQLYPGVGHLFTRNLQSQEIPDYDAIDRAVSADATEKAIAFLRELGFAEP